MFWDVFERECTKMEKYPTTVVQELGFNKSAVTSWRKGALPQIASRKKIADYFGITVEELMDEKKEPAGMGELDKKKKELVDLMDDMSQEEIDAFITLFKSKAKK